MEITRRHVLGGTVLATVSWAGCLQGEAGTENDGGEPTTAVPEEPRVDEPPYEIETPPDNEEEWNPLYLCENMPAEPNLEFQMISAPRLTDPLLSTGDHDGNEYAVRALTSAEEVRQVFDVESSNSTGNTTSNDSDSSGESEEPIDAIDFENYVVLAVESGYGSGAITHHWKHVETTDRGFRLHGCHRVPYVQTADVTSRHSVLKVEKPESFEFPRVSLTVAEDRRVHFNSTEEVVSVDPQQETEE